MPKLKLWTPKPRLGVQSFSFGNENKSSISLAKSILEIGEFWDNHYE
jgi:hypothetical protein